jgi:protein tyrosine phosphatase
MFEHYTNTIKDAHLMICSNFYLKRYKKNNADISIFFVNFSEIEKKLENNYEIIIVINKLNDYLNILKEYFDKKNKNYSIMDFSEFIKKNSRSLFSKKKKRDLPPIKLNSLPIPVFQEYNNFNEATEIIPGLYLSGIEGIKEIRENGISYVISLMKNTPIFDSDIKHMKIEIDDGYGQDIHKYFHETHIFIDEAFANNKNILVHCRMGISRSATIIISYIMKRYKIQLDEAIKFVKRKRPIIDPNFDFYISLRKFESELNLDKSSEKMGTVNCRI